MPLITADDYITRRADGFDHSAQFRVEAATVTTAVITRTVPLLCQRMGVIYKAPSSMPTGVTKINPVAAQMASSTSGMFMLARLTNLGSVDISTNTFTAGSVMPTRTEGNTSRQIFSGILLETITGLNALPGTLVVTYKDNNGNAAEASASFTLTISSIAGSMQFMLPNAGDLGAVEVTNMVRSGGTTPTGVVGCWGVECLDLINSVGNTQLEISNMLTSFPFITPLGVNDEVVLIRVGGSTTNAAIGSLSLIGESA